jgi:membrane-associated phospholipid phosphatase
MGGLATLGGFGGLGGRPRGAGGGGEGGADAPGGQEWLQAWLPAAEGAPLANPAGAAAAATTTPTGIEGRLERAYAVRVEAARRARDAGLAGQHPNGDEERVAGYAACYSKGLPHDREGQVDARSYRLLLQALRSGRPEDFEAIPLGGFVRLANPQGAWAYSLLGPDAAQPALAAPPELGSAEQAAEMAELYWQAAVRDVPFAAYEEHPQIAAAAADLSRLTAFRGPRQAGGGGGVSPATLFRGTLPGDAAGPYVSQFLLKDVPLTPHRLEQRIRTAVAATDYLTGYPAWLANQNGALAPVNLFDQRARFIRNGRDLGEYVHRDFSYQPYLNACLMALRMGVPADGGNPYKFSRTQAAFVTFGQPYLLFLLAVVTQCALATCWFQKWRVHRRLRPEEMGGRIDNHLRGTAVYPLHADLLGSAALAQARRQNGSALLPQAYPEGCPTHPSYPAGHAVIAGACVTALKACFDESYQVPQPVIAAADGLSLQPFRGAGLTVGGELDKLASNVALGRNFAGIHWRSDATAGLALGEQVAIEVLAELHLTGNEMFQGFSLHRFDGTRWTVG